MISRRAVLCAIVPLATACRKQRGDGFAGYAFVANRDGRAIAAVDLTAFAVAKHIRLPASPTEIWAAPNGPFLYALTPESGELFEIDASKLAVGRTLKLGAPALTMRAEPGGSALWIPCPASRRLLRVDPALMSVTAALRLPGEPTHLDLSNSRGLALLGYSATGEISTLQLATGDATKPVRVAGRTGDALFRSDGRAILVADTSDRQLAVLDSVSLQPIVRLPLAISPDNVCAHPSGGQIFISGAGADAVVVVHPYYVPQVAETVLAGSRPGPMTASATHLFVTNPQAGDVTILSVARRKVIAVAQVGAEPRHVTVTPDGEYALVLNQSSGDMAVLRIAGLQPDRRKSAALFTLIPVGSRPVSATVKAV
ncbi:MAG TPA: hypothetical protein VES20_20085 [Bryobacteraceae bacterium]|nr:hypothetical protein [Bryobacteraceae bacterium]